MRSDLEEWTAVRRPRRRSPAAAGGFVLAELAAVLVVVAALAAILMVAAGDSRRQAMLHGSLANLKHFAFGTSAYAADYEERVWGFSWRAGQTPLGYASDDMRAAAMQATDIIRRLTGNNYYPHPQNWSPHVLYTHLILVDYLGDTLPARFVVSPADRNRLEWQAAMRSPNPIQAYCALPNRPESPTCSSGGFRWAYTSSYELPPAFWSPDARQGTTRTTDQAGVTSHHSYSFPSDYTTLSRRRLDEVRFPSQKVMVFDTEQRHFGSVRVFFAYPHARLPLMLADGSANVRATGDANRGFQPNFPANSSATYFRYTPEQSWEAPTFNGGASETVIGHFRWTRSGLRGRDFSGPEVPWQP